MAAPFPNDYTCRLVAPADAKACTVCYKPTSTVLLAANKADFFYVCPLHLKDKTFASPVIPQEYLQLLKDKTDLEAKVRKANADAEAVKPYSWNKLMTNIGWSENPTAKASGDNDTTSDSSKTTKDKTYNDLVEASNELKKQLADITQSIAAYSFKKYTLESAVYKMRLSGLINSKIRAKRQQDIQSGSIFPAAPSASLG